MQPNPCVQPWKWRESRGHRDTHGWRLSLIQNQWIVFYAPSDWRLKLGIVSAIPLLALFWILCASFPSFLRKKELFAAGYPLVWYILQQLFTSVLVKSGGIFVLEHCPHTYFLPEGKCLVQNLWPLLKESVVSDFAFRWKNETKPVFRTKCFQKWASLQCFFCLFLIFVSKLRKL